LVKGNDFSSGHVANVSKASCVLRDGKGCSRAASDGVTGVGKALVFLCAGAGGVLVVAFALGWVGRVDFAGINSAVVLVITNCVVGAGDARLLVVKDELTSGVCAGVVGTGSLVRQRDSGVDAAQSGVAGISVTQVSLLAEILSSGCVLAGVLGRISGVHNAGIVCA